MPNGRTDTAELRPQKVAVAEASFRKFGVMTDIDGVVLMPGYQKM